MTDAEGCLVWLTRQSNTQTAPLLSSELLFFHPLIWNPAGVSFQIKNQTTGNCSAGVVFARSGERRSAQVQASWEEGLLKNDTLAQDEAFYQQCKTNGSMLSAQNLPGNLNISHVTCCFNAHIVKALCRWRCPTLFYEVLNTLMTFN